MVVTGSDFQNGLAVTVRQQSSGVAIPINSISVSTTGVTFTFASLPAGPYAVTITNADGAVATKPACV